ncbi:MAG: diguanylate cyclase [Sandaracinaceae bacterium]
MELDAIQQLSAFASSDASLDARLRMVCDACLAITGADHASVRILHEDGTLEASARAGVGADAEPERFTRGQGVLGWVAEHGRAVRIADVALDARFDPRTERGFDVRAILCAPVFVERSVRAVLSASSARASAFTEDHERAAMLLTAISAQELRMAEMSRRVITDPLTGAYSRGYLEPRLEEEVARCRRNGEPLSLLLIDLDHFKRVNDEYGHAAGDEVLRQVVSVARASLRSVDVVVRRGGEEFVAILPGATREEAAGIAERVRARIAGRLVRLSMGLALRQTASIGVATWNHRESAGELEARADHAMYRAKRAGRNRVCSAERAPSLPRATLGKYD